MVLSCVDIFYRDSDQLYIVYILNQYLAFSLQLNQSSTRYKIGEQAVRVAQLTRFQQEEQYIIYIIAYQIQNTKKRQSLRVTGNSNVYKLLIIDRLTNLITVPVVKTFSRLPSEFSLCNFLFKNLDNVTTYQKVCIFMSQIKRQNNVTVTLSREKNDTIMKQ